MESNQFAEIVATVDGNLDNVYQQYSHASILELSAIILARLVVMNDVGGSGYQFRELMADVVQERNEHRASGSVH
jgi:hypothetical protein